MPDFKKEPLSKNEFNALWEELRNGGSLYKRLTTLAYSDRPEIQDLEWNTDRGLKIHDELHRANVKMKFYPLLIHKFKKLIEENISENQSCSILEIGSGHGYVIIELAKVLSPLYKNMKFSGLDIHEKYVCQARENADRQDCDIEFFAGDALKSQTCNGKTFDFILMSIFIHHLKPYDLYRLLTQLTEKMNHGFFIVDVRRDFFNLLKTVILSPFNPEYSADFKKDAIQSMRRAYTLEELNWILSFVPGLSSFSTQLITPVFLAAQGLKK